MSAGVVPPAPACKSVTQYRCHHATINGYVTKLFGVEIPERKLAATPKISAKI